MPRKKSASGKTFISLLMKGQEPVQYEITSNPMEFKTAPAEVTVEYGITLSREFQSARVSCGVTIPCYIEDISSTYNIAWEIAEKQLALQTQGLKKQVRDLAER